VEINTSSTDNSPCRCVFYFALSRVVQLYGIDFSFAYITAAFYARNLTLLATARLGGPQKEFTIMDRFA
jgi:hypothetical protein